MTNFLNFFGAILGLIIIAPFFPFIALAIKTESPGPVIVRLPRISKGKIIYVYKFRSMIQGAHELKSSLFLLNERRDGPFFKIKNDPRVTKTGRIIRRFRIDEFPQLINVLKSELSLVGPRPHELDEINKYPDTYQHLRFAKAGVTGLSQVNGASSLPFLKELAYDHHYVQQQSLLLDLKIIAKTLTILFFDHNAV